jgi:hypothetical protein
MAGGHSVGPVATATRFLGVSVSAALGAAGGGGSVLGFALPFLFCNVLFRLLLWDGI